MKTTKTLLALIAILLAGVSHAQKIDWGKPTIAELEEKQHPSDPSAPAAILYEKGVVRIIYDQNEGFVMDTEVKVRVKIYKKDGYKWANKSVSYYLPSNHRETVRFEDAVTFNLVDGQIVKTKLKSDGEFDEQRNRYWGERKITMPAVKEGSVIEYAYRIHSPNMEQIRKWDFQYEIPVNYSELKTMVPEYLVYQSAQKGFIYPLVTQEKVSKSITFQNKERSMNRNVVTTGFSQDKVDYTETQTTYILKNLPAMKEERFVNNIGNYTSSISFELSMTRFPKVPLKSYSTDWESVAKTIYKYDDFGPELSKTGYFEAEADKLLTGVTSQDERLAAIFNYVKNNMTWNKYFGYACHDGVRSAFKARTGNIGEINLMLIAMLRYAGFNANPVLISTRSNGIALFPSTTAFNAVIAAVETDQKTVLLDATDKFSTPNMLPLRDLNWFGRLIRKDGTSEQIELTETKPSRDVKNLVYSVKSDGTLEGKIRNHLSDHHALDFRQQYATQSTDSYLEALEGRLNNIEITDYKRENELDFSKAIVESYSFKHADATEIINSKLYVSPLLFLAESENPFKQEKREYPIDFGYPTQNKYTVNIEVPEGYTVESMPAPMNLSTGDEIGSFKYNIALSGNKIQIVMTTDINTSIVPADYYDVIKAFYQKMLEQQAQKIVLVKA